MALDGALQMKIFKRKSALSVGADSVDFDRLSAIVNRGRAEAYPLFEPITPDFVERRFWTPYEVAAAEA